MDMNDKMMLCTVRDRCAELGMAIGDVSDGYHTFNELYRHRTVLFSVVCNQNRDISWKSKQHDDGTMFDGMFIVGINTLDGQATYHCDLDDWDMFDVKELEYAPKWDGHTSDDVLDRLQSIGGDGRWW